MATATQVNLFDFDRKTMTDFFVAQGEKSFRAQQVFKWIHQSGEIDYTAMSNLSLSLRQWLQTHATVNLPEIISEQVSQDGTCKWLLKLVDGNSIETVFIPEDDRGTLCISSQVGCALNCSFCATARQGFNRNLTVAEIIGQLWIARRALAQRLQTDERIVSNVVMMGMGEPLLNFDNVVAAMDIMMDDFAYGLSKRRVTLSTSGVVPALKQLKQVSECALAISLHASRDDLRNILVPINKKYPLAELLSVCRDYFTDANAKRVITMEYVMLEGINDTEADAKQLAKILRGIPCKVNLIPFNPFVGAGYQRSKPEVIARFRDILIQAGYVTVTRKTRGDDIAAACGQLVGEVHDKTRRSARYKQRLQETHITRS